jgi:hypothetical protein
MKVPGCKDTVEIELPASYSALEEINLPTELAHSLQGCRISATIEPAEAPMSRQVEPSDVPCWIKPDGTYWNDYRPVRVSFADSDGRQWKIPRWWLSGATVPAPSGYFSVTQDRSFAEQLILPTAWDLADVNIPWSISSQAGSTVALVMVQISPPGITKVFWEDFEGAIWRIPNNWRRHRIQLPSREVLSSQGIPDDVAEGYAAKLVSVNYHPGSLCCLPDQYRFRDEDGNKWPVKISDCILVGYGDSLESAV